MESQKTEGLGVAVGKFCRVSFVENAVEQYQKGTITGEDEHFIYLKTFNNFFAINKKDIIKVKCGLNDGRVMR